MTYLNFGDPFFSGPIPISLLGKMGMFGFCELTYFDPKNKKK